MKRILLLGLTLSGCTRPAPPPEDIEEVRVVDVRPGTPLHEMLEMLDAELVAAMTGGLDDDAAESFHRAEALTDRLLEARIPFAWITDERYSVESRLRQIQSQADRVQAQLEHGSARQDALENLAVLREDVVRLHHALQRGGGPAPPSLASLMVGHDTIGEGYVAARAAAAAAAARDSAARAAAGLELPIRDAGAADTTRQAILQDTLAHNNLP